MKIEITRRDWLNRSATVLGGSFIGAMTGINPLSGASARPSPNCRLG